MSSLAAAQCRPPSVEDVEIDEVLPSYEDVIRERSTATIADATAANPRYQTPSP